MAYFPSSNYDQYHDNYPYYQSYNYDPVESRYVQYYSDQTEHYGNAYQLAPTQSLVGYYYSNNSNNPDVLLSKNANFHENSDYYYDPVSTQFVISYSTAGIGNEANDLEFEEYNPEPFHGGYDISETYGKALPPSDDICYPPTKVDTNLNMPQLSLDDPSIFKGIPSPYGKEVPNIEVVTKPKTNLVQEENLIDPEEDEDEEDEKEGDDHDDGKQGIMPIFVDEAKPKTNLTQEKNLIDSEEDDEDDEEDEGDEDEYEDDEGKPTNKNVVSQVIQEEIGSTIEDDTEEDKEEEEKGGNLGDDKARNEGEYGKEVRRQIPPGYGIEAMDLCEGLFGGYFPCLLKRNKGANCDNCGGEVKLKMDDYECWQGTVDYLFGNPNPYGGSMPEKGSYGDPMYSYQRHYPQESISGQVQYGEKENSSWLHTSRYYYGHNGNHQYH